MDSNGKTDPVYGKWLNTVRESAKCPTHDQSMPMHVFEDGVRWACGHGRFLPPLKNRGRPANGWGEPAPVVVSMFPGQMAA